MAQTDKPYIIGIDLGTTNSAVSCVELIVQDLNFDSENNPQKGMLQRGSKKIDIFQILQLTGAGEITPHKVLPSFLYIPGTYDIAAESYQIPWMKAETNFSGVFAREHGAKVPARLVSSAKSWLCHNNADRRARILPWGSDSDVQKISPVEATSAYIKHMRRAWNRKRGDADEFYFENQKIIITVPASFDEVARDLTVEAAKLAGLSNVTLIEEPLAAFYSWLIRHEKDWSDYVKPGELILVCDVGGGTTDFTLITLKEVDGSPRFERIAVGDHLILGGDNIDLALARRIQEKYIRKQTLSSDKWKTLCHQCRQAKERMLDTGSEKEKITLMGEGSALIAGTITATLTKEDLKDVVLEGFFPLVDATHYREKVVRKGISEFGLPYEQEPAITRHLGWFLEKHGDDVQQNLGKPPVPDLILFNGGSLKPVMMRDRVREAIRHWFKLTDEASPRELANPDPDLAVAMGAAYYGLVKSGMGVKVGSGSARGYYLAIASQTEGAQATASEQRNGQAICLLERGVDEGRQIELANKKFEVLANQKVSFEIFSSSFRSGDRAGDIINIDDSLTSLPPIQTVIQYGKKGEETRIPVGLEAEYTEMGTLHLWCRSMISDHRWQLRFQLRDIIAPLPVTDENIFDAAIIKKAGEEIRAAFLADKDGAEEPLEQKNPCLSLVKKLSHTLNQGKDHWPLGVIRSMADELLSLEETRGRSPEHEGRWLNLVGFCMRPGFGDGFDEHRMQKLWKLYRPGIVFENQPQVRTEWWIMWRRVAAGLKPGQQRQFIQDLTTILMPKKGVKNKLQPQENVEIWMTIANLEHLSVKDKIKWGRHLLAEIKPKKTRPQLFWALSRIGARELLYGPVDRVVPSEELTQWIKTLLDQNWRNPKPLGAALIQLARKTGDLSRDLDPSLVETIIEWLTANTDLNDRLDCLKNVIAIEKTEETLVFGESLPAGLVMHE